MRRVPISVVLALLVLTGYSFVSLYVLNGSLSLPVKQLIFALAGFIILNFMIYFDFRIMKSFVYFFYGVSLFLLVLVFVIGVVKFSSKRWINIAGFFSFQPSELTKITVLLSAALILANDQLNNFSKFVFVSLVSLIACGLIFMQPDMGSALVIGFIYLMFLLIFLPFKYFSSIILVLIASLPFAIKLLKPYQIERLLIYLNPQRDPLGSGYNVIQSIIAVGSGGWFGKGINGSTMTKLNFVPVQYSDFIFSAIGEIWGFVGSLVLLLLYGFLLFFIVRTFSSTKNKFGKGIALGVFAMFFFQILINVGMSVGIMPVTGIPLPFVSYGGNAEIINFVALGLVANVFIYKDEINIGL